jgi:RNA polymerase sigma factor (sigma-70 family)
VSGDFYTAFILPYAGIIIKMCRAYTNSQEDFEDYYQEVCLQIWRSRNNFREQSAWSTWVYRLSLNVCLTLLKKSRHAKDHFASDSLPEEAVEETPTFDDESAIPRDPATVRNRPWRDPVVSGREDLPGNRRDHRDKRKQHWGSHSAHQTTT